MKFLGALLVLCLVFATVFVDAGITDRFARQAGFGSPGFGGPGYGRGGPGFGGPGGSKTVITKTVTTGGRGGGGPSRFFHPGPVVTKTITKTVVHHG